MVTKGAQVPVSTIRFLIGPKAIWSVKRRLVRFEVDFPSIVDGRIPDLPALEAGADGYQLRSVPVAAMWGLCQRYGHLISRERQRYSRHAIPLNGTFDDYMATFTHKARYNLESPGKKWRKNAGDMDVRQYRRPDEIAEFHKVAGALSARTYQHEKNFGLPLGPQAAAEMQRLAADDRARGYLLFFKGMPASYCYLVANGGCVFYFRTGYDTQFKEHYPGNVLRLEMLRLLFAEQRFGVLEFGQGESDYKKILATVHVECVDLLMLKNTLRNRALLGAISAFDGTVRRAAGIVSRYELGPALKRMLRR